MGNRVAWAALEWVLKSRLRATLTVLAAMAVLVGAVVVIRPGGHPATSPQSAARPGAASSLAPAQSAGPARPAAQGPAAPASAAAAWLPFTMQDLAAAGAVAVQFCAAYDTYTYSESPAAYVGKMNGLITGELATSLQASYSAPGVASVRASQKETSTGTAVIDSLRAFGPSSLTFIVSATQHLVTSGAASSATAQYAVTVTGSGSTWQVDNIELGNAGNS